VARQYFEQYISICQPAPAWLQRDFEQVRRRLADIDRLDSGRVMPAGGPQLFDPFVQFLLWTNYEHAVATGGRDATDAELRTIVKGLMHRPKGRPAKSRCAKSRRLESDMRNGTRSGGSRAISACLGRRRLDPP
jgi:hypothetical protein